MLDSTVTIILAGGIGARLYPLTLKRSKVAVPFGGKYRVIDFALTNCLHSGLRKIFIMTQYKSQSLNQHLRAGWSIFNPEIGNFIIPVPAQMNSGERWYQGTADAVFQNLHLLEQSNAAYVLILSGDHVYRMDYETMLSAHLQNNADVTIACTEVPVEEAHAFGVVETNDEQRITAFTEKPKQPTAMPSKQGKAFVSMGLYIFSLELLQQVLRDDHENISSAHDLAKDIMPTLVHEQNVFAYTFGDTQGRVSQDYYWRDIGTVDAFYEANMDLLRPIPPLNLYQHNWPIRTYQPQTPPARTTTGKSGTEGSFVNSMLAGGVVIAGGEIQHSVLFNNVFIADQATVKNSILFNNVHVGNGAALKNCIVDKGVTIPDGEKIGYDPVTDSKRFTISPKGVVVVPEEYTFG